MFPVFFDTCVLLKPYLCDTVLSVAECGLYRPMWSTDVLEELKRNLVKRGAAEASYLLQVASGRPLGVVERPVERPVADLDERRTRVVRSWWPWRLSSFIA